METRLYLYDSKAENYRGKDLSKYVLLADKSVDTLSEELDSVDLTLFQYPSGKEFAPTTKMIYEKWENGQLYRSWSLVVSSDLVTKPVLADDEIYTHNIKLYEASAIAQSRIVDNISVTYKLQDVSLDETSGEVDPDKLAGYSQNDTNNSNFELDSYYINMGSLPNTKELLIDFHSVNRFSWEWNANDEDVWKELKYYVQMAPNEETKNLVLPLPKLKLYLPNYDKTSSFSYVGECSYDVIIYETNTLSGVKREIINKIIRPQTNWNVSQRYSLNANTLANGTIIDRLEPRENKNHPIWYVKKIAEFSDIQESNINLVLSKNCVYNIKLSLHNYADGVAPDYRWWEYSTTPTTAICDSSFVKTADPFFDKWKTVKYYTVSTTGNLSITSLFRTYTQYDRKIVWASAPPVSAYQLFRKAQIATDTMKRRPNQSVGKMDLLFYCSDEDTQLLARTPIIENFYHQKNLWQMFLEIGKYIHSIPKIEFGENDRFLVKWNKLGITTEPSEETTTGTKMSIYNSRNMENYVSACSSYINNAVQIGGTMEEYVFPKSTSNDYLVYNDVAKLIVEKPMIEIVDVVAYTATDNNGLVKGMRTNLTGNTMNILTTTITSSDWTDNGNGTFSKTYGIKRVPYDFNISVTMYDKASGNKLPIEVEVSALTGRIDITSTTPYDAYVIIDQTTNFTNGFIFSKEIYELLSITEEDQAGPLATNKGRAIYYELGSTEIKGLDYRLPSISQGDQRDEYAIKRILGLAFGVTQGEWKNIKVNDFYFKITYRTKDNLRSEQSRPDLRHYLLNSTFDNVPQHKQFNNQEDIMVDTDKLGNNIYGKLIKTGNTEYNISEWHDDLYSLKKSGELYTIGGQWYYVSKVTNTYYSDHVISDIEYSKDYNKLSEIVGIPSEPRFFEISEQSAIDREVVFNQYLALGTKFQDTPNVYYNQSFEIDYNGWKWIAKNLLGKQEGKQPRYVVTIFKNDQDDFPIVANNEKFLTPVINPVNVLTFHNTLSFEWDMKDNFSAGDSLGDEGSPIGATADNIYRTLIPVRYKDVSGRADLVDFMIINDEYINKDIKNISDAPLVNVDNVALIQPNEKFFTSNVNFETWNNNRTGVVVSLDNRETFRGNYNIQTITDSDRFVISSYFWALEKQEISIALLNTEVNKISNNTIPTSNIIDTIDFDLDVDITIDLRKGIELPISRYIGASGKDISDVKAIALIDKKSIPYDTYGDETYFVCARNVSDLSNEEKKRDWYLGYIYKEFFEKQ